VYLQGFASETPPYLIPQERTLEWLAAAASPEEGREAFLRKLRAYGCGPDRIRCRGTWIRDFAHLRFDEMAIFRRDGAGKGASLAARSAWFEDWADEMAERLLDPGAVPRSRARELIHVSCTGYASPSAAQKWAVRHRPDGDGGGETRVAHAYHMGCYAALPAIRQAMGSLASSPGLACVDVLHTEACSLHFHPEDHRPEQLVIQSLFADGAIRYQLARDPSGPAFRILEVREERIPGATEAMTWRLGGHGFVMGLGREVPALIRSGIAAFARKLLPREAPLGRVWHAVHPGGPRIVDQVAESLRIEPWQVAFSREILAERGNMSSATLPHLWQKMLESPEVRPGDRVLSLAFGPGLTVFGMLMERTGS
jgi:predicted naringenin-chalcone synthase